MLSWILRSALAATVALAATNAQAQFSTYGNPSAPKGGTMTVNIGGEPTTLNPITGTDAYGRRVHDLTIDSLMIRNYETNEFMPALAEKWEEGKDGKTYTFTLREGAKFHDGKPVTAEDVKFSFDAIFDPKYQAQHLIPYYDGIEKVEVVDARTIKFTTKQKYFGNFQSLAELYIVPKHVYGNAEEGKKKNKTVVGSGPYKLEKYDQGQSIVLVRNKDWWGNNLPHLAGLFNFERVRYRFLKDENISLEALKKGDTDFEGLSPEAYEKKTSGPEWGKKVFKVKTENLQSKSYGYIGWNMRRPIFKDRETRIALTHLMNRDEMNKKFRYGTSLLATGPWYQQSEYADPSVKPLLYDPKKALELLKKAGWTDSDKDGTLDRTVNGKKEDFKFTLIYGGKDIEKYWVLYQADLKKVGIQMSLQLLEWNAMMKNVDEANFDAIAMAWSGGNVDFDPKQIWHSESMKGGGSNFVGYNNPTVDKLIEEGRAELDKKKRIAIYRKIYSTIAADAPYAFLFNDRYLLYGHSADMKMVKPSLKYRVGYLETWWRQAK